MIKTKLMKAILIGTIAVFTLTGCGNKKEDFQPTSEPVVETKDESTTPEEAKEDVPVEMDIQELSNAIVDRRTDISFVEMTEGYLSGVMNFDTTKTEEYAVYVDATGTTVDEFGIFKAKEGCQEEVEKMLTEYLATRLDTWMDEYMPEEKPKVENAEIRNQGSYYLYVILGDSERQQTFSDFDSALSK